jgi:hypothetical protein
VPGTSPWPGAQSWRRRRRTDNAGRILLQARVPRALVARDPAIVLPDELIGGVLSIGADECEWRPAASEFHRDGLYHVDGQHLSSADMTAWYEQLAADFPIWSIEDGLAEDDWDGRKVLTERLGHRVQLVGDDIFVTTPTIIADAVTAGSPTPL